MKLGFITAICDGMSFEEVVGFASENGLEWHPSFRVLETRIGVNRYQLSVRYLRNYAI
jgi:hypothetical protein